MHEIFFKLGPVWNATLNPNFCISFLIFGSIFGTEGEIIVCFLLVLLLLLLLLVLRVFFSNSLIIFVNAFLSCPFSQNISVRYSVSALRHYSEQILLALPRNPLNMLVTVSGGMQECGLIRAGLRWTSNSYLLLLFFIFMSGMSKHFSPFSSSMINWMCLSCLFKIFWNLQDCSLDANRAWVSSTYRLYVVEDLRLMLLQWLCVPNSERNFWIKQPWKIIQ